MRVFENWKSTSMPKTRSRGWRPYSGVFTGGSCLPLMPYLMKECANGGSNQQEQYFRLNLCSARNVIECDFRRLKAWFGALKKAIDINIDELPFVVYACFILHNFCEINEGKASARWEWEWQSIMTGTFNHQLLLIDTEANAMKQRARECETFSLSTLIPNLPYSL